MRFCARWFKNMERQAFAQVRDKISFSNVRLVRFFHAVENFGDVVFVLA